MLNPKNQENMLRFIALLSIIVVSVTGCNGQQEKQKNAKQSANLPETDIKVNKEYDEQGNLIRYDSTYSYYYSNIEEDQAMRDSIFNAFREHFNDQYFFSNRPFFENFFFEDSLLHYDFYKEDFFSKRFQYNMQRMEKLFKEMDSVKNQYYLEQFPETQKSEKMNNKKR